MKKTKRLEYLFSNLHIGRRSCNWMLIAILSVLMLVFIPTSIEASAATVSVDVNGSALYTGQDLLKSGVTYVPLRAFADAVHDDFRISWHGPTKTATVRDGDYQLTARVGDRFIVVNGARIYSTSANLLIGNRIYVPVRSVSAAMGLDVYWNRAKQKVLVSGKYESNYGSSAPETKPPHNDNNNSVDSDELYWLARIIHAESAGEPMAGKIAVGTVVMNRVKSSMYPNTIYGVIFDRKYGTQFTPAASGTIYNNPSVDSVEAARRVLSGERTDSRILFFVNEKLAPDNWISKNRTYIMTIGNHKFYA